MAIIVRKPRLMTWKPSRLSETKSVAPLIRRAKLIYVRLAGRKERFPASGFSGLSSAFPGEFSGHGNVKAGGCLPCWGVSPACGRCRGWGWGPGWSRRWRGPGRGPTVRDGRSWKTWFRGHWEQTERTEPVAEWRPRWGWAARSESLCLAPALAAYMTCANQSKPLPHSLRPSSKRERVPPSRRLEAWTPASRGNTLTPTHEPWIDDPIKVASKFR